METRPICGGIFLVDEGNITIDPHAYEKLNSTLRSPTKEKKLGTKLGTKESSENITGINANFEHVILSDKYLSNGNIVNENHFSLKA